jgi:peptidoglycan hydrolase FlgJ
VANIGNPSDISARVALDTQALGDLKRGAKDNAPEALKGAATQFEAMFINMMMKSMRDATPQEGMFDNQQTKMFTSMLDQQMSQNLAKRGVGLADMLVRQLTAHQVGAQALAAAGEGAGAGDSMPPPMDASTMMTTPGAIPEPAASSGGKNQAPHVRSFRQKLAAEAEEASRTTGIPAKFMLGQAALESGWGKREIRNADGSPSHNLFGIKAGPGWKGKVVTAVTTEYINGKPHARVEKFRAYDSYADGFKDYAQMLTKNPRYQQVVANAGDAAGFAHGLQRAGYATDPLYAAKLSRIIKHSLA